MSNVEYLIPNSKTVEMVTKELAAKRARSLAVAYEAYHSARHLDAWGDVFSWARILMRAQDDAGVVLLSKEHLEDVMLIASMRIELDNRFEANDGR